VSGDFCFGGEAKLASIVEVDTDMIIDIIMDYKCYCFTVMVKSWGESYSVFGESFPALPP
jgi:hypothetical protein